MTDRPHPALQQRSGNHQVWASSPYSPRYLIHQGFARWRRYLHALKSARSKTAVIILTAYASIEYLARAIKLGAAGFLSKEVDPIHIVRAIRVVRSGDSIIDRAVLQKAMREFDSVTSTERGRESLAAAAMTKQETRILRLIAEGLSNDSIAEMLSVTRNTVKTHVSNILSKLGVSDRTQAAIWAVRQGLVD